MLENILKVSDPPFTDTTALIGCLVSRRGIDGISPNYLRVTAIATGVSL